MEIKFKPDLIEKAEEYYKTLHMDPKQRPIVDSFVQILSQHLPIPERALKGFMWRVLTDYQIKRHMAASESEKLDPAERIKGLMEILALFKEALTRVLISQEQEPLLDNAISKVIKIYKEKFANR